MPIDAGFQTNRLRTEFENLKVWRRRKSNLGIYGIDVAVDFDLCIGDGACIEVCPTNVFDWLGAGADGKAVPSSATASTALDVKQSAPNLR